MTATQATRERPPVDDPKDVAVELAFAYEVMRRKPIHVSVHEHLEMMRRNLQSCSRPTASTNNRQDAPFSRTLMAELEAAQATIRALKEAEQLNSELSREKERVSKIVEELETQGRKLAEENTQLQTELEQEKQRQAGLRKELEQVKQLREQLQRDQQAEVATQHSSGSGTTQPYSIDRPAGQLRSSLSPPPPSSPPPSVEMLGVQGKNVGKARDNHQVRTRDSSPIDESNPFARYHREARALRKAKGKRAAI